MHAIHLHARLEHLHGESDTCDEPSPANRNDDLIDIRKLVEYLKPYRALSGNDIRVIERMDHSAAGFLHDLQCAVVGIIIDALHKLDSCPIGPRRLNLRYRSTFRDADYGIDSLPCCGKCDPLRMIAG